MNNTKDKGRRMKDSGIEWIGKIPEDWKLIRNKSLFFMDKQVVGDDFTNHQLLSLTTKGVKEKDIDNPNGKLPESFSTYQVVNKDDLILCLFDIDVSAVFSGISDYEGMITSAYKVVKCREKIIPMYANYWFRFVGFDRIYKMYSKSLRYTINSDEFGFIATAVPPKSEQQRIANFLDQKVAEIDHILDKTKESIEEYKKYKQSIITEAVTKGLNPDVEMKDSGIEWIGEIPKHWNTKKMKYSVKLRNEKDYYDSERDVYVGLENIESYSGRYIITDTKYTDGLYDVFRNGDVLFNKLRPYLTKCLMPSFDGFCTGELLIISEFYGCKKYLFYYLISPRFIDVLNSSTYGTKMPRANWDFIKELPITLPDEKEQQQIAEYLDFKCTEIDSLIAQKEQLLSYLESYKKSLIYECVTGKRQIS